MADVSFERKKVLSREDAAVWLSTLAKGFAQWRRRGTAGGRWRAPSPCTCPTRCRPSSRWRSSGDDGGGGARVHLVLGQDHQRRLRGATDMCRWLAYSGAPVNLEELLFKPPNSLVMQSKHSKLGATTTNGDGFGVGWYGAGERPGVFRSTEPAWNDRNLRELSAVASLAPGLRPHPRLDRVRGPADQLPSRSGTGTGCGCTTASLAGFPTMKRDLAFAVDPALFPDDRGFDRLRDAVLPGPHLRPRGGPAGRGRPCRRPGRGDRPPARHRRPGADDRGDHRR